MKNKYDHVNEKALIILLKNDDYKAFTIIYELYSLRILGRLIRLVRSEEMAEELLQELFVRIWEKRASIDPNLHFKSYLFSIAQNLVYDHFRKISLNEKFRSHFILSNSEGYEHVEEDLLYKQTQQHIMNAIAKLPPQCRRVFVLFKLEGKSYQEICDSLQISKSTVNNHITKANMLLKDQLPYYQSHGVIIALVLFLKTLP